MAYEDPSTVVAALARTATGQSGAISVGKADALALLVNVTAVSGTTPSMTISIEWSHDGGTTWAQGDPADQMTAITAAAVKAKQFNVKAPVYRVVWTITGTTPSFTFAVSQYATHV